MNTPRHMIAISLLASAALASGCLEAPPIEERWTRLEIDAISPDPNLAVVPGDSLVFSLDIRVTFRDLLTATVVADLCVSDSLSLSELNIDGQAEPLDQARQVDGILRNATHIGRTHRIVTGFDSLVREFELELAALVPADLEVNGPDSLRRGLFLVVYPADTEEIRLSDGSDSLAVFPLLSDEHPLLSTGFRLGGEGVTP